MRALIHSALALVLLLGCSSASDPVSAGTSGAAGSDGNGDAGASSGPTELEIEAPERLEARALVTIRVQAQPAGVYRLEFALPTSNGDPLDAVLDRSEAETDASGRAEVQLTAPSSPTTFELRVSSGSLVMVRPLAVADSGMATVQVEPRQLNLSALRDINTWIASAHTDKTCAELAGIPPEDGPIRAPAASKTDAPIIPAVPAGIRLAITLRSGHFIGGCTTVESLRPGPVTSPQVVVVTLFNRPIDLSASALSVSFGLGPNAAWSSLLTEGGTSALTALVGPSANDVDALLDAMREASGDSRQVFENTRKAEQWDDVLRARWGASASTALQDLLGSWLVAGRARFASAEPAVRGSLVPLPQSAPRDASAARLSLTTVASVSATAAGFADSAQVVWSASPDDTVALGTDLYFVRSRFATALAEAAAVEASSDVGSAPAALAARLDCAALGAELAASGPDATVAYGECGADCLAELCERGLSALWDRAADADGLTPTRLSLTATGKAYVGDGAEIAGLTGTWIGELEGGGGKRATSGALTAATPLVPK